MAIPKELHIPAASEQATPPSATPLAPQKKSAIERPTKGILKVGGSGKKKQVSSAENKDAAAPREKAKNVAESTLNRANSAQAAPSAVLARISVAAAQPAHVEKEKNVAHLALQGLSSMPRAPEKKAQATLKEVARLVTDLKKLASNRSGLFSNRQVEKNEATLFANAVKQLHAVESLPNKTDEMRAEITQYRKELKDLINQNDFMKLSSDKTKLKEKLLKGEFPELNSPEDIEKAERQVGRILNKLLVKGLFTSENTHLKEADWLFSQIEKMKLPPKVAKKMTAEVLQKVQEQLAFRLEKGTASDLIQLLQENCPHIQSALVQAETKEPQKATLLAADFMKMQKALYSQLSAEDLAANRQDKAISDFLDTTSSFINSEICKAEDPVRQRHLMKFFLDVANESLKNNDLATAMAIYAALKQDNIQNLVSEKVVVGKIKAPVHDTVMEEKSYENIWDSLKKTAHDLQNKGVGAAPAGFSPLKWALQQSEAKKHSAHVEPKALETTLGSIILHQTARPAAAEEAQIFRTTGAKPERAMNFTAQPTRIAFGLKDASTVIEDDKKNESAQRIKNIRIGMTSDDRIKDIHETEEITENQISDLFKQIFKEDFSEFFTKRVRVDRGLIAPLLRDMSYAFDHALQAIVELLEGKKKDNNKSISTFDKFTLLLYANFKSRNEDADAARNINNKKMDDLLAQDIIIESVINMINEPSVKSILENFFQQVANDHGKGAGK